MKKFIACLGIGFLVIGAVVSSGRRYLQERRDRQIAIVSDWSEVRLNSTREGLPPIDLLKKLQERGTTAIALSAITLEDLWTQRQLTPVMEAPGRDAFDTATIAFSDLALASMVYWEFSHRGVSGLERPRERRKDGTILLTRAHGSFLECRQIEAGYDTEVLEAAKALGLRIIFRVSHDAWFDHAKLPDYLKDHPLLIKADAILFNTDVPLGGRETLGIWSDWMKKNRIRNLLFEFKPPRSQKAIALRIPDLTDRAHTIPVAELRDLLPSQEMSRWRRAFMERSCRFLLVHDTPEWSLNDYLIRIETLKKQILHFGYRAGWPLDHRERHSTPRILLLFFQLIAFMVLAAGPLLALYYSLKSFHAHHSANAAFFMMSTMTVFSGLLAAALSSFPETQLQITPFRGIKAAFLIGWVGSLLILFRPQEIGSFLRQSVRRWDLLLAGIFMALLAYALIRSGNAGSGWKATFEQHVRDWLEWVLPARPRFKEFVFGHPLMVIGLLLWRQQSERAVGFDSRIIIFLGMMGQVSMINTFAHLHSPIDLAVLRSILGIMGGFAIGWTVWKTLIKVKDKTSL